MHKKKIKDSRFLCIFSLFDELVFGWGDFRLGKGYIIYVRLTFGQQDFGKCFDLIMTSHRIGYKPSPEPMLTQFTVSQGCKELNGSGHETAAVLLPGFAINW